MKNTSASKVIAVIFIILGIGVFAAGAAFGALQLIDKIQEDQFFDSAEQAVATCEDMKQTSSGKTSEISVVYSYGSGVYTATLEQVDGSNLDRGVMFYVYVDPLNPADCRLPHQESYYMTNLIFFGGIALGGLILLIIGIAVKKKSPAPRPVPQPVKQPAAASGRPMSSEQPSPMTASSFGTASPMTASSFGTAAPMTASSFGASAPMTAPAPMTEAPKPFAPPVTPSAPAFEPAAEVPDTTPSEPSFEPTAEAPDYTASEEFYEPAAEEPADMPARSFEPAQEEPGVTPPEEMNEEGGQWAEEVFGESDEFAVQEPSKPAENDTEDDAFKGFVDLDDDV